MKCLRLLFFVLFLCSPYYNSFVRAYVCLWVVVCFKSILTKFRCLFSLMFIRPFLFVFLRANISRNNNDNKNNTTKVPKVIYTYQQTYQVYIVHNTYICYYCDSQRNTISFWFDYKNKTNNDINLHKNNNDDANNINSKQQQWQCNTVKWEYKILYFSMR